MFECPVVLLRACEYVEMSHLAFQRVAHPRVETVLPCRVNSVGRVKPAVVAVRVEWYHV